MVKCRASLFLGDQFIEDGEELMSKLIGRGAVWEAYELFQRSTESVNPQPLLDFLQDSIQSNSFDWLASFLRNFDTDASPSEHQE